MQRSNDLLRYRIRVDQLKVGLHLGMSHCLKVSRRTLGGSHNAPPMCEQRTNPGCGLASTVSQTRPFRDADGRELISLQLQWIISRWMRTKPSAEGPGQFYRQR